MECQAKLLGNTEAEGNNGILKNTKIAVPSRYLSNDSRDDSKSIDDQFQSKIKTYRKSIAFCLQLMLIIQMLILIIFLLLSKTQNYMFLL